MQGVLNIKKAPPDEGFEFVLAGRSNAGKSSALNCLAKNKKLARTSKHQGELQKLIFLKSLTKSNLLIYQDMDFLKCPLIKKRTWILCWIIIFHQGNRCVLPLSLWI